MMATMNRSSNDPQRQHNNKAEEAVAGAGEGRVSPTPQLKTRSTSQQMKEQVGGVVSALHEALGVTAKGTCIRHPNCPVFMADTNRVMSCRVCFSEEKSVGIQQRKSFAAVVQQLTKMSSTSTEMGSVRSMGSGSGAGGGEAVGDANDPDDYKGVLQSPQTLESIMKRLAQVQNWMLRQKEKEVLSLQLHIHRLEQRLADSEQLNQEQKQTIRALRRTIQQDLKLIKSMAAQKQLEMEQAEARSLDDSDDSGSSQSDSPQKHGDGALGSPPKRAHKMADGEQSGFPLPNVYRSPPKRVASSPQKASNNAAAPPKRGVRPSRSRLSSQASLRRISEDMVGSQGNMNSESLRALATRLSSRNLDDEGPTPERSTYWHEEDVDPAKLFLSFRGGLLDIPKSPPAPVHDARSRKSVQLDPNQLNALKMPARGVISRNSSSAEDAPPPRKPGAKMQKEIPLDLLAQTLSTLPLSRNLEHQSPLQFFREKADLPKDMFPAPLSSETSLIEVTSVADSSNAEARRQEEGEQTTTSKAPVTGQGATCQDRFGDPGMYTGTILVTEGLPHGKGTMNYESGRVYSGNWVSGQWHGQGTLLNPNGDTYDGEFVFDARHGNGVYKWDNGDVYTGEFQDDKRHGKGKFCFHNGNVYDGEFCDGMFEGYGRYEFDGGYYEGEWKAGRYHGSGELKYANGARYTGEFRNSVAHGFGMEVTADGHKRRGVWEEGQPGEYFER